MRILLLLVMLALAPVGAALADDFARVEPQALAERLESADPQLLVLDVRSAAEFDEGHIPGAVNIPHDVLGERIAELGPVGERDVVVYCRSGRRAAIALEALKGAGFRSAAIDLEPFRSGRMNELARISLPVVAG